MLIGGLQKLTLIDYPGKLACVVFLIGCNFRCSFCHNAELVLPEKIKKHTLINEKEFFNFLKSRQNILQGVCVTGGEPTIHKDLIDFLQKIKKLGYAVKLDTNGSNPEILKYLIEKKLIDYVAMDIKAPLESNFQFSISNFQKKSKSKISKYQKAVGVKVDLDKIKKSINIIKNSGIEHEFRTTVVPGIHTKEDILQIARDIAPAKRYFLQNFRPQKTIEKKFLTTSPYPEEFLKTIQRQIASFFEICEIRT